LCPNNLEEDSSNKMTFFFIYGVLHFFNAIHLTSGQLILLSSDTVLSETGYSTTRHIGWKLILPVGN